MLQLVPFELTHAEFGIIHYVSLDVLFGLDLEDTQEHAFSSILDHGFCGIGGPCFSKVIVEPIHTE